MAVSVRYFLKGIELRPTTDETGLYEGTALVNGTEHKLKIYLDGALRKVLTEDQAQPITNKTIDLDNNTLTNIEVDNLKSGVLNTSTTLATASDAQVPSALAVKTYVDDKVATKDQASEITSVPSGNLSATNVQDALNELQSDIDTRATATGLSDHINDTVDAHAASAISNIPSGNLAATDLQGAVNELQSDIDTRATTSNLNAHTSASSGVHGVVGSVVGTTDAQTVSNKNLSNSSVTNPSRLDLKKDTKANLQTYALTATDGQMAFATDTQETYVIKNGLLSDVGGGGSGVGGTDIMSADTADRSTLSDYTQTGLEITETPIVLHGFKSFRLKHSTSVKSFKRVIPVDRKFRNKNITVWVDVASTAQTSNLNIIFRDETNAVNLTTSQAISTGSQAITATTANASNQLTGMTNSVLNTLKVGMVITGSAIPSGTTITAIGTTSATMSQNATGVSTGIRISDLVAKKIFSFNIPANCQNLSWEISSVIEADAESYIDDIVLQLTEVAKTTTSITVPKNNNYSGVIENTISIVSTGTQPTKGVIVTDRIVHSRIENRLIAEYEYEQTSGGSNGTGDFLFSLPNGLQFDPSVTFFQTQTALSTPLPKSIVGYGKIADGSNPNLGVQLVAYDATRFRAITATNSAANFMSETAFGLSGAIGFGFHLDAAISGWVTNQTETKTIPLTSSVLVTQPDSYLKTGAVIGGSSTNTLIRTFSGVSESIGDAFTYTKDAVLGDTLTVKYSGTYSITYTDSFSGPGSYFGISKNTNTNTSPQILPTANTLAVETSEDSGNYQDHCNFTGYLNAGDVLRFATSANNVGANLTHTGFTASYQGSMKILNPSSDQKVEIPTHKFAARGASTRGTGAEASTVKFDSITEILGDGMTVSNTNGTIITFTKNLKVDVDTTVAVAANQITSVLHNSLNVGSAESGDTSAAYCNVKTTLIVAPGDTLKIITTVNPSTDTTNQFKIVARELSVAVALQNVAPRWDNSDTAIAVNTANGYGSTANKIKRFSNITDNFGSDIEYIDSTVNGASFIIKTTGQYSIALTDSYNSVSAYFGISKNSSQLTTGIQSINLSDRLAVETTSASTNTFASISWQGPLTKGDVIRVHSDGSAVGSVPDRTTFVISKVGKTQGTVDVTPFVNIKTQDTQAIEALTSTSTFGSTNTGVPVLNITKNTNNGVIRVDSSAADGTSFVALKDCAVNISSGGQSNAASSLYITRNSTVLTSTDPNNAIEISGSSVSSNLGISTNVNMKAGEILRVQRNSTAVTSILFFMLTATADNNAIATPTQQISSDTMSFVFKATAIDPAVDPVGTFNTYSKAANTQTTNVLNATAPTQTAASMNVNGILISPTNYATASTAALPSKFDIFIGKGLKDYKLLAYDALAKGGNELHLGMFLYSTTEEYGIIEIYNETTGILTLDAGGLVSTLISTRGFLRKNFSTSSASGYFVFNASKAPSLVTVPNLQQRIAYLSDVKANATAGGSSIAGTQTRTLNTLVDSTGIITSLASNQFTLPAGTYSIEGSAPAFLVSYHKARVRNITDGSTAILGSSERSAVDAGTRSFFKGEITITSPKVFEVQHYTQSVAATNGLGLAASSGDSEVFTQMTITKIK